MFALPLRSTDSEPVILLAELLEQAYQEAALDLVIDYDQRPEPALSEPDVSWLETLSNK